MKKIAFYAFAVVLAVASAYAVTALAAPPTPAIDASGNVRAASTLYPGVVTTGTQSFAGAKTFTTNTILGASGTGISLSKRCSATLATSAITAGNTITQSITCAGCAAGADCLVGPPATLETGLNLSCHASATNTIVLYLGNITPATVTPAANQIVNVRYLNP